MVLSSDYFNKFYDSKDQATSKVNLKAVLNKLAMDTNFYVKDNEYTRNDEIKNLPFTEVHTY